MKSGGMTYKPRDGFKQPMLVFSVKFSLSILYSHFLSPLTVLPLYYKRCNALQSTKRVGTFLSLSEGKMAGGSSGIPRMKLGSLGSI